MKQRSFWTVLWMVLAVFRGSAQSGVDSLAPLPVDTVERLPTFELRLPPPPWHGCFNPAGPVSIIVLNDTWNDHPTLAQQFARIGVPFRTYGPASLATTTIRGANAAHTTVRWNGLTLNSPLNGTVDFSLVPPFLLGTAMLRTGDATDETPIDGLVATVDVQSPRSVVNAEQAFGNFELASFGNQRTQIGLARDRGKHHVEVRGIHHTGRNDFPRPPDGTRTPNAQAQTSGVTASWNTRFKGWNLHSYGWLQYAERQIPPSITQSNDHAQQRDQFRRVGVTADRFHANSNRTQLRYGLSDEALWFESDVVPLAFSTSLRQQFEAQHTISNLTIDDELQIAAGGLLDRGFTDNINGTRRRQVYHLRAGYNRFLDVHREWQFRANVHQGWTAETTVPLTFSVQQRYQPSQRHRFAINVRRSFNLPNLNDLYWTDAFARGNADLKAERGWNLEGGHTFATPDSRWNTSLRGFLQWTQQRIVWLPNERGVYQPQNFRSVQSRGLEAATSWTSNNTRWRLWAHYRLTQATVQRINNGQSSNLIGRQLPYVPAQTAALTLRYQRERWRVAWRQQFVGSRHTLFSDQNQLPAYLLSDLSLEWNHRSRYFLTAGVNNLFDQAYEGIAARPLPGRGYFLRLAFNFSRTLGEK